MRNSLSLVVGLLAVLPLARAERPAALAGLEAIHPAIDALYVDLHRNPELSLQEEKTAAKLAASLRELGYEVTERVGGHGVVGVLRNGTGPVVMIRTDLDALPIREATGLPYASTVEARNPAGDTVPVMHACGHDVHMASWVGAATLLVRERASWRGTLVFIGQPAEEILNGAAAMIDDGLLTRFPRPDVVLGLHVSNSIPAGQVGVPSGPASAASNGVDITIHGRGGHGAAPHLTVDPLLIAARTVVTLQTIVAREVNPLDPAVVTVGTLHAGTKRNIIADEAALQLTVRSYKPEVQQQLLTAIQRITAAEAAAANAPRQPEVRIDPAEASEVVVNDPALSARLEAALRRGLGAANVAAHGPVMASEDFGVYGRVAGVPSVQLRVGAPAPDAFASARAEGRYPPGPHNSGFAPDRARVLRAGTAALTLSALELLGPGAPANEALRSE